MCNTKNRKQELVRGIADYLTDWTNDDSSIMEFDKSIEMIESYGISYDNSCDELVVNAIRHLDDIINPWNKTAAIPEILDIIGFTEEEIKRYNCISDSIIWVQFK